MATQSTRYARHLLLSATLVLAAVPTVIGPTSSFAQTSKGIISGSVRDRSGAVIPNVSVTITNQDTGETRTAQSQGSGSFRFDAIMPGRYKIHAEVTGFKQVDVSDVAVGGSVVTSYDLVLDPGEVSQTISVEASSAQLNTENGSLSGSLGHTDFVKLPIFSLNPIELATTVPGAQAVHNSGFSNGEAVQVSGARPRANNFLIDGQEINDTSIAGQALQPNIPEMYADEVIYTHNPPAEFGRASGGVVNLITRGGTNAFHGSAWELYSGSGLNALDSQLRQSTDATKTRFDQHQIGFTAGGPIIKDKLFAFGAGQWSRFYGQEQASTVELPDQAGVALLQQIAAGPNATTAANAKLLLQYLTNASYLGTFSVVNTNGDVSNLGAACPGAPGSCQLTTANFIRPPAPQSNPDTQWTYRIDYIPRQQDTFYARYLHDRSSLSPDFFNNGTALPGFDTQQGGPSEIGQGGWTHVFSPQLLNEFRVAETRLSFLFSATAATLTNPLYSAYNVNFGDVNIPQLGFDQNLNQGRAQEQYQFQDTLSWTHGRHTIRVGADVGRRLETDTLGQNANGTLTLASGGSGTSGVGNFLLNQLGPSGTATRTFGSTRVDPHSWRSGAFAQDDFKLSPSLTVNLGIRYDYFTNPENVLQFPAIDAANPFAPITNVYKIPGDTNNIAPRVGFAYSPDRGSWFGGGNTVIRGGFGVFFDSDFTNILVNSAQSAPNAVAGTLISTAGNGLGNATSLVGSINPVLTPQASVESVVNNFVSPYTLEWNLGLERTVPGGIILGATYVGSGGRKLYANRQYNYFSFDTQERLNPDRGAIIARGNFAASSYNGLETYATHRFQHGIEVRATYTYSKSLDNSSEVFTTDSAQTSYQANLAPEGMKREWGNSAYDHRQFASFVYVWTPGGLHSDNHGADLLLSALTRHWTVSGIEQFQSGPYSTVNFSGVDSNGDGSTANDRPILSNSKAPFATAGIDGALVGGAQGVYYDVASALNSPTGNTVLTPVNPSAVHWLIPYGPQFTQDAIGRNSYLNPGSQLHNISLEKAVPASWLHLETGSFVFRAEAEDFPNHNNVGIVDINLLNIGTSAFLNKSNVRGTGGTYAAPSTDGRQLRFWAKFVF